MRGDPGQRDGFSIVMRAFLNRGDKCRHPGYSPQEVKLSTWGGAKEILGKKVDCNWPTVLETKQKVEGVRVLSQARVSVLRVFGLVGREVI